VVEYKDYNKANDMHRVVAGHNDKLNEGGAAQEKEYARLHTAIFLWYVVLFATVARMTMDNSTEFPCMRTLACSWNKLTHH
jgi:beta-glucosidase-like glycosyl hydrolase